MGNVQQRGKAEAVQLIQDELEGHQKMKGTDTYNALKHAGTLNFRSLKDEIENRKDVLFLITDGEPRDTDRSDHTDILDDVRDKFDYVFTIIIGDPDTDTSIYDEIQGKINTTPIISKTYEDMSQKLVQRFNDFSRRNDFQLRRMKRSAHAILGNHHGNHHSHQ